MKTLTVALIVKNEQAVLARVLGCAKKFADEIVVVDTGSTDDTKKIAKEFDTSIFDFKWIGDFSAARNFAFSKANCDLIMWLDADDIVTEENIQKILDFKNSQLDFDTVMAKYCTGFDDDGKTNFWFFRERILKNCRNARWCGKIHEVIAPFGKIWYSDIEIFHKPNQSHTKRNLDIYKSMLKQKVQFEPRELYYFARELYYDGQYKRATMMFKRFLKLDEGYYVDKAEALKILYYIYKNSGETEKATECLLKTMKYIRPRSDICCLLGDIFAEKKNFTKAVDFYKMALVCESNEGFVATEFKDFTPNIQLCVCYFHLNQLEKSIEYHKKAKVLKPNHPSVQHNDEFFKSLEKS